MVVIALKTIGDAARFFLKRHWVRTRIGPYVVTTTEVRPGAYETNVSWGEAGDQVEEFGSGLAFDVGEADADHKAICTRIEEGVGQVRAPSDYPPAA